MGLKQPVLRFTRGLCAHVIGVTDLETLITSLATSGGLLWFWLSGCAPAFSQGRTTAQEDVRIQDNSFLVEEAYNQERGVVQHISSFSRMWNSRDWSYSFTQEWPAPRNWRHQFSYTLVGLHSGAYAGTGGGVGDAVLNYRYQVLGDGDSRMAFAPRVSTLIPTGDVARGRGAGGAGVQVNLPVSVVLHRGWLRIGTRAALSFRMPGTATTPAPGLPDITLARVSFLSHIRAST